MFLNAEKANNFIRKSFKEAPYFTAAVIVHILVLIVFAFIYVIKPATGGALLKGRIVNKKTSMQKVDLRQLRKKMAHEVPVKLIKKIPVKKKALVVKKVVEESLFKKQVAVKPELAKVEILEMISENELIKRKQGRQKDYKNFVQKFGLRGKGRSTKAKIQLTIARYMKGDWYCHRYGLENFVTQINRWTNIEASIDILEKEVDSEEIFESPFVYMTGHNDFVFTEEEVINLRKYLLKGGAVYCDNSLAGKKSRFDMAFRREMKKVLPDRNFEEITLDHSIFHSFYTFNKLPAGMNWKDDKVEVIKIRDRVIVVYTLNDYGDLWKTGLNEKDEIDFNWYKKDRGSYQRLGLWGDEVNFENVNLESIKNAYKLGINIVVYMLQRGNK